jgi:hypothetical protein
VGARSREKSQFNRGGKKMLNAFDEDEDVDIDVDMIDLEQSQGIKVRTFP